MARTILCVTAHPDDEAGGFGGTLARYSGEGVACRVLCLTAGAAARNRGPATSDEDLKRLRRQELADACVILGVAHEIWDLPDGGLPQVDFFQVVGQLVAVLRTWRPDLVLTMGPEGAVTGHPDHAMAGICATAAFHWAAHERHFPPQDVPPFQAHRLFYNTALQQPPEFPPVWLPPPDVAVDVEAFLDRKIAAFRAHRTQAPLAERVEAFMRSRGGREYFHLAAGVSGLPRDPSQPGDLFQGL